MKTIDKKLGVDLPRFTTTAEVRCPTASTPGQPAAPKPRQLPKPNFWRVTNENLVLMYGREAYDAAAAKAAEYGHPYNARYIQRCLEQSGAPAKPLLRDELIEPYGEKVVWEAGVNAVEKVTKAKLADSFVSLSSEWYGGLRDTDKSKLRSIVNCRLDRLGFGRVSGAEHVFWEQVQAELEARMKEAA